MQRHGFGWAQREWAPTRPRGTARAHFGMALATTLLLGVFTRSTCAFEMPADPAFTQRSSFGITVGRDPKGRLLVGSEAVTMATISGAGTCPVPEPSDPPVRVPLTSEGWFRVHLLVPARWMDRFEAFASRPTAHGDSRTELQALQALFQQANALMQPILRGRHRPAEFTVEIALVPSHCHSVASWDAPPQDAMRSFLLHLHVQEPTMLEPLRFQGLPRWLLAVVVHEAMHVLQLAPFDLASVAKADPARQRDKARPGLSQPVMTPRFEVGAMLLEHCVTEALAPRDGQDRAVGLAWQADRSLLERLRSRQAPYVDWMIRRFEWLLSVTEGVIYPDDEALLLRQLSACAALVRDPGLALARQVAPTAADVRAALEGLQAARRLGPPFRSQAPARP